MNRPLVLMLTALTPVASLYGEDAIPKEAHDDAADAALHVEFDPLRGMDENGRIPKAPLPADLDHPERWRYVPEGRIAPGNVFQRFLITSFIAPIIYYEKDVGAGGGIALTDIDFRGQRRQEFLGLFASHSTEGQEQYAVVWNRYLDHRDLPGGGVITEERSQVRGEVSYERTLTRRFFGLGPRTVAGDETSYTDEVSLAELTIAKSLPRPVDDLVVQFGLRGEHHNLSRGRVSGVPDTGAVHPGLVAAADSHDALWVTGELRFDSRDSPPNPYRGWALAASLAAAPLQDNGDSGAIGELRGTWAISVPSPWHDGGDANEENPPTDTVVVSAFVEATAGDLPFYSLPSLGGSDTLRGYIGNRFTDRTAWHAAIEYRFWPHPRGYAFTKSIRIERFGLALFYELGTVAADLEALPKAPIHDSYGIGLRLGFERNAIFRIDYGLARDSTAVTVAFGLSF